jgi:hypothetical protein
LAVVGVADDAVADDAVADDAVADDAVDRRAATDRHTAAAIIDLGRWLEKIGT